MNLSKILPAGLAPEDFIVICAALAAAVSAFAVWQALLVRDDLTPRLKALAERRAALKANMLASLPRSRRKARDGLMHSVVARLNLLRSNQAESARLALARAGIRSKDAVVTYLFCKIVLPFLLGGAALVSVDLLHIVHVPEAYRLPIDLGAVLLGFLAPGIYVKNASDKRKHAMQKGLPDALDLLVICAEAGLSLDAALTRGVVNTLLQTEKYGTPLAQSLRVLAAEFRNERLTKAEEKAARLPAILTVPMIIFILPPLFIVLIGPAILRTVDALRNYM
jgi:tight adherence protein C